MRRCASSMTLRIRSLISRLWTFSVARSASVKSTDASTASSSFVPSSSSGSTVPFA
jgi:hypothetical protein